MRFVFRCRVDFLLSSTPFYKRKRKVKFVRKRKMISKRVKAVVKVKISTGLDVVAFLPGDEKLVNFRNQKQLDDLLATKTFVVVEDAPKPIKVKIASAPITANVQRTANENLGNPTVVKTAVQQTTQPVTSANAPIVKLVQNAVKTEPVVAKPLGNVEKCKTCSTLLIPVTDESDPQNIKQDLYCPKCQKNASAPVVEKPAELASSGAVEGDKKEEENVGNTIPTTTGEGENKGTAPIDTKVNSHVSRCPICGKRKDKTRDLCKACFAKSFQKK